VPLCLFSVPLCVTNNKELTQSYTEKHRERQRFPEGIYHFLTLKTVTLKIILFGIILFLTCCSSETGNIWRCYYVSGSGRDSNPGTREKPWKTVSKINATNFNPGDTILLEGGSLFPGTICLDSLDSGSEGKEIFIGSYGNGRAIIDGGKSEGFVIEGCKYLSLNNLEIKGSGRKEGNNSDGVFITLSEHVNADGLEVSGFQHTGLHVHICSDIQITNVYTRNNGFSGINITGNTAGDPERFDNEDIYIGYCIAENNPGDPTVPGNHSGNGILASSVNRGVIEYCESFNNGWDMPWTGNGPVGIWIWDCTDFKIQYCISHDNKTNPVAKDGGGFDLDGGVSNSVIQYCLSFNNQGGGYGLFEYGAAKPWENNTLRYCISFNDGSLNGGSVAIWRGSTDLAMRNCDIYNNTFYNATTHGYSLAIENNSPGFRFFNNIFVFKGAFLLPGQKLISELFLGNCYFNLSGDKSIAGFRDIQEWADLTSNEILNGRTAGIYTDPMMNNPAGFSLGYIKKISSEGVAPFTLQPNSPLIGRGLDLNQMYNIDPGDADISGNALPQGKGFDIGALEFITKK
jgi:hypothetical protein